MSVYFDGSSSYNYIKPTSHTPSPITLFCWFNVPALQAQTFICINSTTQGHYMDFGMNASGTIYFRYKATLAIASTSNTASINTWQSCIGIQVTTSSRFSGLNGTITGTNSSAQNAVFAARDLTIGARKYFGLAVSSFTTGCIGEIAIWNRVLYETDYYLLDRGANPLLFYPKNILYYYRLGGFNPNILSSEINTNHLYLYSGNPKRSLEHPPIKYNYYNQKIYNKTQAGPTQSIQYGSSIFSLDSDLYNRNWMNIFGMLSLPSNNEIALSPQRIIQQNSQFQNDSTLDVVGRKVISGVSILSNAADVLLDSRKVIGGASTFNNAADTLLASQKIIRPTLNLGNDSSIGATPSRILYPSLSIDAETSLASVPALIINGSSNFSCNSDKNMVSSRLMNTTQTFLNNAEAGLSSQKIISALCDFSALNNCTIIPSLIINGSTGLNTTSTVELASQRVISQTTEFRADNLFSLLPSLIMRGQLNNLGNTDVIALGETVAGGDTLLGQAIFDTFSNLGLNSSLVIGGSTSLFGNVETGLNSNRVILPTIQLSNDSNTSLVSSRIISSILELDAYSDLDLISKKIIQGQTSFSTDGRLDSSSQRVITGQTQLQVISDFLLSLGRVQLGTIILSNDTILESNGRRLISGVLLYDSNSILNGVGSKIITGGVELKGEGNVLPNPSTILSFGNVQLRNDALLSSQFSKIVIIPFTLNIAQTEEINLSILQQKNLDLNINRIKEFNLGIKQING